MRKTEDINKDITALKDSGDRVILEMLLDIRNTLVSMHIENKKHA